MARYSKRRSNRRGSARRSFSSGYGQSRPRAAVRRAAPRSVQRLEIVHRYVSDQGPAGYAPGVPGMVGVANVPAPKKGKTF